MQKKTCFFHFFSFFYFFFHFFFIFLTYSAFFWRLFYKNQKFSFFYFFQIYFINQSIFKLVFQYIFIFFNFFVKKSPKKGTLRTIFCQNFFSILQNGQFRGMCKMKSQKTFSKKTVLREPFFGDFFWRLFYKRP